MNKSMNAGHPLFAPTFLQPPSPVDSTSLICFTFIPSPLLPPTTSSLSFINSFAKHPLSTQGWSLGWQWHRALPVLLLRALMRQSGLWCCTKALSKELFLSLGFWNSTSRKFPFLMDGFLAHHSQLLCPVSGYASALSHLVLGPGHHLFWPLFLLLCPLQ